MIRAGVIGHPIAHSLSPKLHGYWLKLYGIAGEYKAYDVAPEHLADFIKNMEKNQLMGCNVTIPHKETVMEYLDEVDDLAKAVGAVNTIVVRGKKTYGSNTDVAGFYENVKPHLVMNGKAVILGAGGAARAVAVALKLFGFTEIAITNRTASRAEEIACAHKLQLVDWEEKESALKNTDLLVNTTSLGMHGKELLVLDLSALPVSALVTDIVYKPLITPLLAAAKARGNPTVDGLGMLLQQGVPGFAAWFGVMPEVTEELRKFIIKT